MSHSRQGHHRWAVMQVTMMGQAGRPSFHYPALPCPTLLYSVLSCFVCLLEFNVEEIMQSVESIQRAMKRDQPKTPEPMRSTPPNTDQPCIPHSEYHYIWRRRQGSYYSYVIFVLFCIPVKVLSGVLVRLTTCNWLTDSLPKLSLITLSPPETAG